MKEIFKAMSFFILHIWQPNSRVIKWDILKNIWVSSIIVIVIISFIFRSVIFFVFLLLLKRRAIIAVIIKEIDILRIESFGLLIIFRRIIGIDVMVNRKEYLKYFFSFTFFYLGNIKYKKEFFIKEFISLWNVK